MPTFSFSFRSSFAALFDRSPRPDSAPRETPWRKFLRGGRRRPPLLTALGAAFVAPAGLMGVVIPHEQLCDTPQPSTGNFCGKREGADANQLTAWSEVLFAHFGINEPGNTTALRISSQEQRFFHETPTLQSALVLAGGTPPEADDYLSDLRGLGAVAPDFGKTIPEPVSLASLAAPGVCAN